MTRREPTADARNLAAMIRDHVDALADQGFTEDQALRFLAMWAGSVRPADPPENPSP